MYIKKVVVVFPPYMFTLKFTQWYHNAAQAINTMKKGKKKRRIKGKKKVVLTAVARGDQRFIAYEFVRICHSRIFFFTLVKKKKKRNS